MRYRVGILKVMVLMKDFEWRKLGFEEDFSRLVREIDGVGL